MTLLSLAKYAASHGVSKQAATRWKSQGAIVFHDGRVDVEASDKLMRRAGLGRFKSAPAPPRQPSTSAPSTGARPVDAWEAVGDVRAARAAELAKQDPPARGAKSGKPAALADAKGGDIGDIVAAIMGGHIRAKVDAEELKENALAAKHLVGLQREAGLLIPREEAERALFEAARQFRDAWLNWPVRIGPYLAADLGLAPEVVVDALSRHVHDQLALLGEPEARFDPEGAT